MGPEGTPRWLVEEPSSPLALRAYEPSGTEIAAASVRLAEFYNAPRNSALLGNSRALSPFDVEQFYAHSYRSGGRPFLLEEGLRLVGDADLRNVRGNEAEFAILIGAEEEKGRGLGSRFAIMLHHLAFEQLSLSRLFVSIAPHNGASLRLFQRLGYAPLAGAEASAIAEEPHDVAMALTRDTFLSLHGAARMPLAISRR